MPAPAHWAKAAWQDGLASATNVVGLGLLLWGLTAQTRLGLTGGRLSALVLLLLSGASWAIWAVLRLTPYRRAALAAALTMGCAGGALAAYNMLAVTFMAVAALAAGTNWPLRASARVVVLNTAAMALAVGVTHRTWADMGNGVAAAFAGLVLGTSRRQAAERAGQSAEAELEATRAELEHARAEVLAERNRLAREIHDVLAHTLSALSVQLEAFDADLSAGAPVAELERRLAGTKTLVRSGLADARKAVAALREDTMPLSEQLGELCRLSGALLNIHGERDLPAPAALALYRVAQEGLTNAMKHAPGRPPVVDLAFAQDEVVLNVRNQLAGGAHRPLAGTGGGYGLQGMRERVLLLGGEVSVGPDGDQWVLTARVPVAA